jgi:tetratricopeptide (TPR) repeat protein
MNRKEAQASGGLSRAGTRQSGLNRRLPGLAAASALAVLLLASGAAKADDALDQAKTYFSAGAQAYDAGRFGAAVQAFQQAYALAPRPAILFSMAQAERKAWFVDKRPDDLKHAIEHYHAYLAQVPSGGRRGDAADGLAELEPIASRMAPQDLAGPGAAPAVEAKTRIMVTCATAGARASLDGGPETEVPLIDDVKPGKHHVRVAAAGYFDEERDALAAAGSLAALDVALRPRPALLSIQLATSAAIAVDGRPAGTSPLGRPLELPAGPHYVTATKNGYEAFAHEVTLERGKAASLAPTLESSGQRTTAWAFFGAAGAGLLTGGAFTGAALVEQSNAQKLHQTAMTQNVPAGDIGTYDSDVSARDRWRTVAIAGYGAGVGLAAIGAVLWVFDTPNAQPPPQETSPRPGEPPKKSEPMDMSLLPWVGPGGAGIAFGGRM